MDPVVLSSLFYVTGRENIVAQFARNNLHCFKVELCKTDMCVLLFIQKLLPKYCGRLEQPG